MIVWKFREGRLEVGFKGIEEREHDQEEREERGGRRSRREGREEPARLQRRVGELSIIGLWR